MVSVCLSSILLDPLLTLFCRRREVDGGSGAWVEGLSLVRKGTLVVSATPVPTSFPQ